MKLLACFAVLCLAVAHGLVIQSPGLTSYAAPYATYSAGIAPVYHSSLAYSPYLGASTIVRSAYAAPTVYHSPVLRSAYATPAVYGVSSLVSPLSSVYGTILKK